MTDMSLPAASLHGEIPNMQSADYHALQALSASGLRHLRRSPAHYYAAILDPERPAQEPTPAMRAGTMAHCALFEPEALAERYIVRPDGVDFRTKAGKEWRDAQPAGLEIIDAAQMQTAQRQAAAVRALPDIAALLAEGRAEVSAVWRDDATGALCRCRPDWVAPAGDGVVIIDGKTTQDASPDGFGRSIWTYAYHLQAAWYIDGWQRATGQRVHGFVFAAVESAYPHAAAAYMLGDDVIAAARAECARLTALYAECMRSGHWPGYNQDINLINLPAWARMQLETINDN